MIVSQVMIQIVTVASVFHCAHLFLGVDVASAAFAPSANHYVGTTDRIRGFDPVKSSDTTSSAAISKVYEGLYEYEYLIRPYTVRPLLAESMPEISSDGLTYTIRIKKGVKFVNDPCFPGGKGREVTAADFVYSWKRIADIRNKSTCYWIFSGRIAGLDEYRKKSILGEPDFNFEEEIEGLKALDKHTLQIKLIEPYPQLIWVLTMSYTFVVPHEAVNFYGSEFLNNPVGTGPFVISNWKWRNYSIEYTKNPNYHGDTYPTTGEPKDRDMGLLEDAGKQVPLVDKITQYIITDDSTEWLKFLAGDIAASGISRNNFDAVITAQKDLTPDLQARGIQLYTSPQMFTTYLGFNMQDPILGENKKLRQALAHCIDIDQWIEFYNNRMIPASGPIPPAVTGYDPEKPLPYKFDLSRARKLLTEAGYPDGRNPKTGNQLEITLDIGSSSGPEERQSVDLLISFFRQIGVKLNPQFSNWPEFLKKLERKQVQMFRLGWKIDYPDAENFLQLFYSKNASPGPNHTNYNNPRFDELYEEVRAMQDTPERTRIYQQMAEIIIEDSPWIFLTHPLSLGLFQPWLGNFKPHDFPYPNVKYYKVNPSARRN